MQAGGGSEKARSQLSRGLACTSSGPDSNVRARTFNRVYSYLIEWLQSKSKEQQENAQQLKCTASARCEV